jgi:alpha-N-arabinofuranosidase
VGTGTPQEMANWIEYLNLTPDPSPTGEGRSSELSELRAKNGHPASYKVSFWGVGNESWGCGGDMTPAYYADLYKHYANFCKTYPGNPRLKKIVSGANADDYNWTETIMKNIPTHLMWGVSLHYYTWLTGHWPPSGSATSFTEKEYFQAMNQALRMEEILNKHEAIMDKYDPAKKVALLVDEWGIWTAAEPGTNPAFLYQQNSLRDALIAGTTLNIFNNHCDRVKVANLAQAVNVIHSVILTKGDSMVLTPTYHVFDLYKVHQDARLLPVKFTTPYYVNGKDSVQAVNISASKDSTGTVHISLVNIDANKAIEVEVELPSGTKGTITGRILTSAKVDDYNDFGKAEKVGIKAFTGFKKVGGVVKVVLPSKCVVVMEIR